MVNRLFPIKQQKYIKNKRESLDQTKNSSSKQQSRNLLHTNQKTFYNRTPALFYISFQTTKTNITFQKQTLQRKEKEGVKEERKKTAVVNRLFPIKQIIKYQTNLRSKSSDRL